MKHIQILNIGSQNKMEPLKHYDIKFLNLRPVKFERTVNVTEELSKNVSTWGAPQILHSGNGREFVAEVCLFFSPECKKHSNFLT